MPSNWWAQAIHASALPQLDSLRDTRSSNNDKHEDLYRIYSSHDNSRTFDHHFYGECYSSLGPLDDPSYSLFGFFTNSVSRRLRLSVQRKQ